MQTKKNNFYYVITDDNTEKILVSKNFNEIFNFVVNNTKSKLSTIDFNRKPRILDKTKFLKSFLTNVKDNNKFFELSKMLIKGDNNIRHFVNTQNLLQEYINYEQNKNNVL